MGESLRARPQALVILSSPIAFQYSKRFADFAARNGLPAISPFRPFAEAGGLMSYGPDLDAFFRRVPGTIDRLLHGARPGDLAVEQPDRYELVVNRAAGQRLRLALPAPLLVRADEVINAP
jgi:putative ABC transport system substrate-binding protein